MVRAARVTTVPAPRFLDFTAESPYCQELAAFCDSKDFLLFSASARGLRLNTTVYDALWRAQRVIHLIDEESTQPPEGSYTLA